MTVFDDMRVKSYTRHIGRKVVLHYTDGRSVPHALYGTVKGIRNDRVVLRYETFGIDMAKDGLIYKIPLQQVTSIDSAADLYRRVVNEEAL